MKKIILIFYAIAFFFANLVSAGATNVTLISQGDTWSYCIINTPMPSFYSASYSSFDWENDTWISGHAPFGNTYESPYLLPYHTEWIENTYLALNKIVNVNGTFIDNLTLNVASDNGFIFFVNGQEVTRFWASGYTSYWEYTISVDPSFFLPGLNSISVLAQDQGGATFFDMELYGDLQTVPTINAILDFYHEAVSNGTLTGVGQNTWLANLRLFLMREMLEAAEELIEHEKTDWACFTLNRALLRCDGEDRPLDFVEGDAVLELNTMISDLMEDLGCD